MIERFAGRYALLKHLGRGGMGDVYLARDLSTGTECALKRMIPGTSRLPADLLRNEFKTLARVRHPAIVGVHELSLSPDGVPYFTMDYVPGLPADRALRPGDWAGFFFVAAELARGLEALHRAGIAHGDLKPSNVLVVPGPGADAPPAAVRLLDFGLASLFGDAAGHRGTPGFAAPETVRGEPIGELADLYGLGATLYALAVGRTPFEGRGTSSLLRQQQTGPPSAQLLEDAGAPAALTRLVLRLLSPAPAERGADARQVRREIEHVHPAARRGLTERMASARLVGRERELARLEAWIAAPAATSRLTLVTGSPGIGKSAFLDELATRAAVAGRRVARLSCGGSAVAGETARVVLRRLAADVMGAGLAAGHDALRAGLEDDATPIRDEALGGLTAAAVAWTRALENRGGSPLLLLDDIERLDPLSDTLLRRVLLHAESPALHWVWAHGRDAGTGDGWQVLLDSGAAHELELTPLDRASTAELASARLGEPAAERLVEFLWTRGSGHPGLIVDLLRAAADAGALIEDETGVHVDSGALERVRVAEDFGLGRLARWRALPSAPAAALATLAVWGRAVSPEDLGAVEPRAEAEALGALFAAGLITRDETRRLVIAPSLGERIEEALDSEERVRVHRALLNRARLSASERFRHMRAVGDTRGALSAAEAAYSERPDERLAADAATLAENGAPEEAPTWHGRAADAAIRGARYASALPHLERAIELGQAGAARNELRLKRCGAFASLGRIAAVESDVRAALDEDLPDGIRARWLVYHAWWQDSTGDRPGALATDERALAEAQAAGDDLAVANAARSAAHLMLRLNRIGEAPAMAERALAASRRAGDALGEVRARILLAAVARFRHEFAEADRRLVETLEEARRLHLTLAIEETLQYRAVVLVELGQWKVAREQASEALNVTLEVGRGPGAATAMITLALHDGLCGRPHEAMRHSLAAVRLCRAHMPGRRMGARRALAQALRIQGRLAAERVAQRAVDNALRMGNTDEMDWTRVELGQCLAATGRWREAGAVWSDAAPATRPVDSIAAAALHLLAGRAALRQGEMDTARERLAAVDAWLDGHPALYMAALADQLRAEVAIQGGRASEGVAAARRALTVFDDLPAPADRAAAAFEFARLTVDQESSTRAPVGEWLEEAAAGFERLGNRRGRERALTLLVRWLKQTRGGNEPGRDHGLIDAVSRLLHSLSDLHELAQRAMVIAVEQLGAERGVLLLADAETGRLTPMAEHGAVDAAMRRTAVGYSTRIAQHVADSGGSVLIVDAPSDRRAVSDSVLELGLKSIVCVPMYLGGKVVGAVYLDDSRLPEAFSDDDRRLLEGFAHLMAVAIEKSRGHEEVQRFNQQLVGENITLRQQVGARFQAQNLIGTSTEMQRVLAHIALMAHSDSSVLLTGENGTGKELIARIIHHSGRRRMRQFVAVNCGAIPETLLETELFGIGPGVATDVRARDGRFVQADGGTLFLDEIGEMPLRQQVALLAVLSNREVTPVGGGKPILVDVRIIAATNRDLRQLVEEGAFREDLFYRLNVIPIEVPPLRERKADIPALVRHFVNEFAGHQVRDVPELSTDFLPTLMQSDWPGNVRELQNYIERVMSLHPGRVLSPSPLPRDLGERRTMVRTGRGRQLPDLVEELNRRMLEEALARAHGNQTIAARELGLTEQTLRYRMKKYDVDSARKKRRTRSKLRTRR